MLRIFGNRSGTAEVIGTIMFIVIMLFFFTNVYLWHDAAVKDANQIDVEKVNAGMSISFQTGSLPQITVNATSSEVTLSRLWIDSDSDHVYVDLTSNGNAIQISPGNDQGLVIQFSPNGSELNDQYGAHYATATVSGNVITVDFPLPSTATLTIVNTLGVAVSTQTT